MRNEDSELWSDLKTVSSFDNGENSTVAMGVTTHKDLQEFTPSSLLVESLIEQLCKLTEKDPNHQKRLYLMICDKLHQMKLIDRSYDLDELEFMRSHYQKALYKLMTTGKSIKARDNSNVICSPKPGSSMKFSLTPQQFLEWSRYANEFVELEFIARGGFGHVYKARHKLDGSIYAVKKINLRYQNPTAFLRSLKEVKMLACLNHPNIVAYKAAWLEPFDSRRSKVTAAVIMGENSNTQDESIKTDESSDIIFEKSNQSISLEETKSEINSIESTSPADVNPSSTNLALCTYNRRMEKMHTLHFMHNPFKHDWATLFVQMQLCEENMRHWLDRRNRSMSTVNIPQCMSMFTKVLRGLEYIHDKGIVHHDIKPSNIFVSEDLRQVQMGDFGLACCLLTHHHTTDLVRTEPPEHRGGVGTRLYSAPEQAKGICSPKSDIYSMGIVLLELIRPFQTEMERSKIISQLKRGQIPTELAASRPDLARIISQTVTVSINIRPTASELLKIINTKERIDSDSSLIICEKDTLIHQLRDEIAAKDAVIATKDAEILRLKEQLATYSKTKSEI